MLYHNNKITWKGVCPDTNFGIMFLLHVQRQEAIHLISWRSCLHGKNQENIPQDGSSLITVTRAEISPDLKNVKVFLSILPESLEKTALAFAKRNRTDFRDYLKGRSVMRYLPTIDFELDYGEKNRQRIDELTN